jgi:hypothetical protein
VISKGSIEAKFRRSGIQTKNTLLWIDIPLNLKNELSAFFTLKEKEFIIICYYNLPKYALLITTEQIIIVNHKKSHYYSHKDIEDVKLNEIFNNQKSKSDNDIVNVILKPGEEINLLLEKGTWTIMFSIIQLLALRIKTPNS